MHCKVALTDKVRVTDILLSPRQELQEVLTGQYLIQIVNMIWNQNLGNQPHQELLAADDTLHYSGCQFWYPLLHHLQVLVTCHWCCCHRPPGN
jgi:hypothetical protein